MNLLKFKRLLRQFLHIKESFNDQNKILLDGLEDFYNLIIWGIPLLITSIFMLIDYFFHISIKDTLSHIISALPSLTGFLIASLTILISMDNKVLNDKINENSKTTYRQVGAAVFLYATKYSLILIIVAFIIPTSFPIFLISIKEIILTITQFIIFLLFSKLIVSIFYGLLFLASAIENHSNESENS